MQTQNGTQPTDPLVILTALQRELSNLQEQLATQRGKASHKSSSREESNAAHQAKLLKAIEGAKRAVSYAELEQATKLTPSIVYWQTRKLALDKKVFLSLEPNASGTQLIYKAKKVG